MTVLWQERGKVKGNRGKCALVGMIYTYEHSTVAGEDSLL